MQYFIGFSSFSDQEPFDPSLFVEFRKRLGPEQINKINEQILGLSKDERKDNEPPQNKESAAADRQAEEVKPTEPSANEGRLIVDATACPQDIRYPTDLDLLNDAREKSEELIDHLYCPSKHAVKPRTYREIARKVYLRIAQKKSKSRREIRTAIKKQLNYLKRNISNIHKLLGTYTSIPLDRHQYKYLLVIQTFYEQQHEMFIERKHQVNNRIVSIHQPHVRPIVRGKTNAKVEFGEWVLIFRGTVLGGIQ